MSEMFRRCVALMVACLLLAGYVMPVAAAPPANQHFQRTWQRTDQPVASLVVNRTWMWGPQGFTGAMNEMYAEGPGGVRTVQYFDKSRMEITDPGADPNTIWYVTNGLLVMELITGEMQLGHASFLSFSPAEVNVAGDHDDPTGPTYETFGALLDEPALADNTTITQRVDRDGVITNDPALAVHGVFAAQHVVMPGIDHQVASVFWTFMNSNATVYENGNYTNAQLFENPFYATGYPVAEAYWADVKVAGTYQDVLIQCFERRCLTYNPANGPGWQVEAGNVGQHYHHWRYVQVPAENEVPEVPANGQTATEYAYLNTFGNESNSFNDIQVPAGLGIGPNDNLYVVDTGADRIQIYSNLGVIVGGWGSSGANNSQFDNPQDIAFDSEGNAYVTDLSNNRVQKFTSTGVYLGQWGSFGNGAGQFNMVDGIAINSEDVVYVSDRLGDRVQMFDVDGNFIAQFGSNGNGDGQFFAPMSIAIDSEDNVYVADTGNNRIQKFDSDGNYIMQWGSAGDGYGEFNSISALTFRTVLGYEVIAATDYLNHRVQEFTLDGAFFGAAGAEGSALGQLDGPVSVAGSASGTLFVGEFGNNRVQAFGLDLQPEFFIDGDSRGRFDMPIDIAVAGNGDLIVTDFIQGSLQRFSPDGEFIVDLNIEDMALEKPAGIATDENGSIYVTEGSVHKVFKYDDTGHEIISWGGPGAGNGQFSIPLGIAAQDGYVYVTDAALHRVQKFTANGDYVGQWGSNGNGNGQFVEPYGIAVVDDRVYVADSGNQRIQVFDTDGTYLEQFGSFGSGNGQFSGPMMIATDTDGYLYITDNLNHRVQKFSPDGDFVTSFGTEGTGNGELTSPAGIAVDTAGKVYIVEPVNHRVHVFEPVQ
jgi:tripartite motif-containing protein 71